MAAIPTIPFLTSWLSHFYCLFSYSVSGILKYCTFSIIDTYQLLVLYSPYYNNRVFIRRFYRDLHVVQNNLNNLKKSGYVIADVPYVKEKIFRLLKGKTDITSSPSDFDCL